MRDRKKDRLDLEKRNRELEKKVASLSKAYEDEKKWSDQASREYESYKSTLDMLELYLDKDWRIIGYSNNFLLLTEDIVEMRKKGAHLKGFLRKGDFDQIHKYLIKLDEIKNLPFEKGRKWELRYKGPGMGEKIGRDWIPFSFSGLNQWKIEKGRIIHRHRNEDEEDYYLMSAEQFGGAEEDVKVRFKVQTPKDPGLISDISLVFSGASGRAGIHPDLVGYTACSASNGNTVGRIQKKGGVLAVAPEVLEADTMYEITAERTGGRITREIINLATGTKGPFLEAIDTVAIYDRQNYLGFTTYAGDLEIYDLEIFTRKSIFTIDQFRLPFDVEVGIRDEKLKDRIYQLRIGLKELGGETQHVLLFEDITEKKKAEEALRLSEERFRKAFKTSPDSININRMKDGLYVDINEGFTSLTGYTREEAIGKTSLEIDIWNDPKDRKRLIRALRKRGQVTNLEAKFRLKDSSVRTGLMSATIINLDEEPHILSVTRDINEWRKAEEERKKLQEQLNRAHKMESLGLLAGGVAHDLNNILTGLVSYPDLIMMQLADNDPIREYIQTIKDSGQRAGDVVQDLLSLAKSGISLLEILNLNDIIRKYMNSPEFENLTLSRPNVGFETDLDPELMNNEGSGVHLLKVLMNLVSNAAEAMPQGGNVRISTANRYVDKPITGYEGIQEGDYAVVSVSDTGIGIPAEDLHRIFEPFYSKKIMGKSGTGLGMSVVWNTVKDHGGYIDVESAEGRGTTFSLFFPITRKENGETESRVLIKNIRGKGEKILVIDDIREQRIIVTELLTNLGYNVVSVSGGKEAVEYLKTNSADLLLLDMIMEPGIDGLEAYKMILKIHPEQKAIIASGFAETGRVKEAQKLGAGAFLRKPYTLQKLGMLVRKELDR